MRIKVITSFCVLAVLFMYFATGNPCDAAATKDQTPVEHAYIPKDLKDCFAELERSLDPEMIQKMKVGTEKDMGRYHHGLGMYIRNRWGLWTGSRLSRWFNKRGIDNPDDMSGIILRSFWRHLNSQPIRLNEQVKFYRDYWREFFAVQERAKAKGRPAR